MSAQNTTCEHGISVSICDYCCPQELRKPGKLTLRPIQPGSDEELRIRKEIEKAESVN